MTLDHQFLAKLTSKDCVITANRRLSSHLLHQFEQMRIEGNRAWETPSILPLSSWLLTLWIRLGRSEHLLDTFSSRWVWQSILKDFTQDFPLLDYQRAAELAQEAWQYCQQWKIPFSALENSEFEEVKVFLGWAREYQKRLEENAWIDESVLPLVLLTTLPSLQKYCPERLYLVGFDTFSPAIQTLLDTLSAVTQIIVPETTKSEVISKKISIIDRKTEFSLLAQWAKKCWLDNPQQQIGCIVPELLSDRITIERLFYEEFKKDFSTVVNIAGGDSLLTFSSIQSLLLILEVMSGQSILHSKLTSLLLSPYLKGGIDESDQRAILDRELRRLHQESFTVSELREILTKSSLCPELLQLLNYSNEMDFVKHHYPSEWAAIIKNCLQHFGWPGDRDITTVEYQCVSSFSQQLQYYAGLDCVINTHTFSQSLSIIRDLLSKTLFQAQSNLHAPIQVLGLLEASGLFFDQVWITSMNDDTWPRSPSPNPFLPIELQRQFDVPHSSSSHELSYGRRVMKRISESTSYLIASYSLQHIEEQRELSPSPLIVDFTEFPLEELYLKLPENPLVSPLIESWVDDTALPIQPSENIRGGATILQRQAECPFRAFAEIRLKAQAFDEVELGLSAAERGSLVHAVMAEIWRELRSSLELKRIEEESLNSLIKKIVVDVVNDNTPISELEKTRLIQLTQRWLALEKTRSNFSVLAIEEPFTFTIGKLVLRLQVDRIDALNDGSHIIIDYKTGSPSPNSWFGERPDEPQLPLYALHDSRRVKGLAFAQIRSQNVKFNGITAEVGVLPNVKPSSTPWENLLEQWENNLTALANDFCSGQSQVDPKKYPTTCQYCHLGSLCRINERVSE